MKTPVIVVATTMLLLSACEKDDFFNGDLGLGKVAVDSSRYIVVTIQNSQRDYYRVAKFYSGGDPPGVFVNTLFTRSKLSTPPVVNQLGTMVIYVSNGTIYSTDVKTEMTTEIYRSPIGISQIGVSGKGEKIAFIASDNGNNSNDLYVIDNRAGSAPVRITKNTDYVKVDKPVFSLNAQKIAYTLFNSQKDEGLLMVNDVNGSNQVCISVPQGMGNNDVAGCFVNGDTDIYYFSSYNLFDMDTFESEGETTLNHATISEGAEATARKILNIATSNYWWLDYKVQLSKDESTLYLIHDVVYKYEIDSGKFYSWWRLASIFNREEASTGYVLVEE